MKHTRRLCGNRQDAEDLLQDSIEKGLLNFDSYKCGEPFRDWFFRIITNNHKDSIKHSDVEIRHGVYTERTSAESPERRVLDRAEIAEAMKHLTPAEREAVSLFYFKNMPQRIIADKLNCTLKAVERRLDRARKKMKELLEATI